MRLNRSIGYGVAHTLFFVGVLVPVVLYSLLAYLLVAGLSALLMPLLWGKAPRRERLLGGFMLVSLYPCLLVYMSGSILITLAAAAGHYVLAVLITVPDPIMVGDPPTSKRGVLGLLGACMCGLVAFGAALLVPPHSWLPISTSIRRDFVSPQDQRILERAFRHPLPPALRHTGTRYYPPILGPDGPPPTRYRIEADASAWDDFVKQAGLKEYRERDEQGWPKPGFVFSRAMGEFVSEEAYRAFQEQFWENPPLVSYFIERSDNYGGSYAFYDTRTSPSLVIYVSTREALLAESP